jgi:hypothetical protein
MMYINCSNVKEREEERGRGMIQRRNKRHWKRIRDKGRKEIDVRKFI